MPKKKIPPQQIHAPSTKPISKLRTPAGSQEKPMDHAGILTDEMQWENALLFRSILNATPDIIAIMDFEGHIRMASPSSFAMWQIDPKENLVGRLVFDFLLPGERARAKANFEIRAKGADMKSNEYCAQRSDGSTFHICVNGSIILGTDGKPNSMMFILRENTDQKQMEARLIESEERFRSLYENTTIGLYRTTPNGTIILANPALVQMLRYSSFEELASRNLEKEGFEPSYDRKQFIDQIEMQGEVHGLESAWTRHDGSTIYVRESARVFRDSKGKTIYYDGTVEDITERKLAQDALQQSETKYRELIENLNEVIYSIDATGTISYVSPSLTHLTGYTPVEVIGKNFRDLLDPEERNANSELMLQNPAIDNIVRELSITAKDKSVKWIRASSKSVVVDGKVVGRQGIMSDITERKHAEELLQESKQRLSSIYDTVDDVIFFLRVESERTYRFTSVNKAFCQVTGLSYEQVVGKMVSEVIPEPSLTMVLAKYKEALEEKKIVHWEESSEYPRGRLIGAVSIAPVIDTRGNCTHLVGSVHDITDRKLMEDKLRKSEERYRKLVETSPDAITVTGLDTTILTCNQQAATLYGYANPAEVTGKNMFELFSPELLPRLNEDMAHLLKIGILTNIEYPICRQNGSCFLGLINVALLRSADGKPEAIIALTRDITDQKRSEDALRESEARYRELFEKEFDALMVFDPETLRFEDANPAALKLYGYTREEFLALTLHDISAHPDEALSMVTRMAVGDEGLAIVPLRYHKKKDGVVFPVEISPGIFFIGGRQKFIGAVRDITKRKEMEEALRESESRYRVLVETSPYAITQTDMKGRILTCNSQTVLLHGFEHIEELLGRDIAELIAPYEVPRAMESIRRMVQTRSPHNEEFTLCRKDGSHFDGEVNSAVIFDALGNPESTVGISHDITKRKQAEEKISHLLQEKELLLKEMHHRIKNNLIGISSLLDLQARASSNKEISAALSETRGRVRNMLLLYDQLRESEDLKELSMQKYLFQLIDEVASNFDQTGKVRIEKQIDDFVVDSHRLSSVGIIINELLMNAVKHAFIGRKAGLITISGLLKDTQVVLDVADNGVGIPASIDFNSSTGLGLRLVYEMTKQIAGHIRIERKNGTRIILEFDLTR